MSASCYGLRMWIELGFRDLKSFGWDWESSRVLSPSRCWNQWLVMSVSTVLVLLIGTWLSWLSGKGSQEACNLGITRGVTPANRRSLSRICLDFLNTIIHRGRDWILGRISKKGWAGIGKGKLRLTLLYPSQFKPPQKTVVQ